MFGIGGSEIIVILIVALLFLGPDKLPDAAKQISKGIRDLKRGSREIQQTIENDATIGGAIRDLKSALRGEEPPPPRKNKIKKPIEIEADEPPVVASALPAGDPAPAQLPAADPNQLSLVLDSPASDKASTAELASAEPEKLPIDHPAIRLPPVAGDDAKPHSDEDRAELAALIKPASGTIAKGESTEEPAAEAVAAKPDHG